MKYLLVLISIICSSVFAAENQTTICSFGDQQRKIEVIYPEGEENVCEVQYTKNSEMTVLWSARSEMEYCETKASGLIEKQLGWGWTCNSKEAGATDEQEESETDSTETTESTESEIK